MDTLTKIKD